MGCVGGDGGGGVVVGVVGGEGWAACHSRRSPGLMGDPGGCSRGGSHVAEVLEAGTWWSVAGEEGWRG